MFLSYCMVKDWFFKKKGNKRGNFKSIKYCIVFFFNVLVLVNFIILDIIY